MWGDCGLQLGLGWGPISLKNTPIVIGEQLPIAFQVRGMACVLIPKIHHVWRVLKGLPGGVGCGEQREPGKLHPTPHAVLESLWEHWGVGIGARNVGENLNVSVQGVPRDRG